MYKHNNNPAFPDKQNLPCIEQTTVRQPLNFLGPPIITLPLEVITPLLAKWDPYQLQ
jgi:hypothetical protein